MGHVVLLTGAGGMVGEALVPVLAARADVSQIFALAHKAGVRVRHENVIPISGNLQAGSDLGMSDDIQGQIRDRVSVIIHAAADTRFSAPLTESRAANVEGARNLLSFAVHCPRLRGLVALSTVHVAGKRTGLISEDDLEHCEGFVNSYEQSKYESELLLRQSMPEVPISIVRLSTVFGSSVSGEVGKYAAIHHALRLYYHSLAPMIPGTADSPVDLVALDFAASAVAHLATEHFEPGRTFQVCGGADVLTVGKMLELTRQVFLQYRPSWRKRRIAVPAIVDLPTFNLFVASVHELGDHLLQHSVSVIEHFAPQLAYPKMYDDRHCAGALEDANLRKNPVSDFYPKVVRWLVESGWADRTIVPEAVLG